MSLTDKLKTELERRIRQDMTPHGHWHPDHWFKTPFGDFYGRGANNLPVIHRMVGECVDNVLRPQWQMSVKAWQGLQIAIDATDTAESALPDMVRAALNVDPRNYHYFLADAEERPRSVSGDRAAGKKRGAVVAKEQGRNRRSDS